MISTRDPAKLDCLRSSARPSSEFRVVNSHKIGDPARRDGQGPQDEAAHRVRPLRVIDPYQERPIIRPGARGGP